jgi:hypothetical protein
VAGSANGTVNGTASAAWVPPSPVLCLPIGHSAFRRLVELAEREGLDVNTLACNLVLYQLGRHSYSTRAVVPKAQSAESDRLDGTTVIGVVCLACGRERADLRQARCGACGGSWTTAVR